jgi:two-component system cell cycle response regulator DivK
MSAHILIVEDNELNRKLFRDLLEVHNYRVSTADEAAQVLPKMRNDLPDLVLMDIQLHSATGTDIMLEIKADSQLKHIPVIAITAFVLRDDRERLLNAGFEGYIPKPISIDSFLTTIRQQLERAKIS